MTTTLASCWAFLFLCSFFYSLLITHTFSACLVALVSLIIVWATLGRKRWGRLALLGMSRTALGLFLASSALMALLGMRWHGSLDLMLNDYTRLSLFLYEEGALTPVFILLLAGFTTYWLSRPEAAAEFERSKKMEITKAQFGIALFLVFCWALIALWTPLVATHHGASSVFAMIRSVYKPASL